MKILLISPAFKEVHSWEFYNLPFIGKKAFIVPLHIAALAALTPGNPEVDLWDELMQGLIHDNTCFDKEYDLVGITCYSVSLDRAKQIAGFFRKRGIPVAAGGPGVSAAPGECRDDFDILFLGEAELTWPQFIKDFLAGSYRREYREMAFPDLVHSPPPRWDSIASQVKDYLMGSVQPVRGCANNCNFCNVPPLFGRKMRHKPIDTVLEEVRALERLGIERILFSSDNLIGNSAYAKDLLRQLIPLNNSFKKPLSFHGELTITAAQDEEMLSLLADANFVNLFIGIETPNKESLKDSNKLQNLGGDLTANCRNVMAYGLPIEGSMVLGFDQDTPGIFDTQFEFLQNANIPYTRLYLLRVKEKTGLWTRLWEEARILDADKVFSDERISPITHYRAAANIIPKQMSREQLFSGYLRLAERVYDWENFAARLKGFVAAVKRKPNLPAANHFPGGPPREFRDFLGSLEENVQQTIFDIFSFTRQHAAFMMAKVVTLIIRQYVEVSHLPLLREAISKQIRFEESQDIEQFMLVGDTADGT